MANAFFTLALLSIFFFHRGKGGNKGDFLADSS